MNRPDTQTPRGRAWLAAHGLRGYAERMRKLSCTRGYSGPQNAEHRENLRAWADAANKLADDLDASTYVIDPPFEED